MIASFRPGALVPPPGGSVVSLGMFDGVHRGHQAILGANVESARALGARATVVTFRRHPKKLLLGNAPRTLTTLEHRLELFSRAGIDHAVVLNFDSSLRSLTAAEFTEAIAVRGLGVRRFVLGFDSKFGRDRGGTPEFLRSRGFEVLIAPKVNVAGRAVSSTAIREAVELGDLSGAAAMLGRRVSVFGRVVRGSSLGHRLGFPTANLDLHHELHPPPGVYATAVHHLDAGGARRSYLGVTNIGFRPTVAPEPAPHPQVEVHVLDFDGDLYGERIELEFVSRLRGEKRFSGVDELVTQIGRDVREARAVLASALSPEVDAPPEGRHTAAPPASGRGGAGSSAGRALD